MPKLWAKYSNKVNRLFVGPCARFTKEVASKYVLKETMAPLCVDGTRPKLEAQLFVYKDFIEDKNVSAWPS